MKAKEIQDLINFISDTGLEEVNIETDQFKLKIKRSTNAQVTAALAPVAAAAIPAAPAPTNPQVATPTVSDLPADQGNLITIKSPMIGTFYRSSNPETPPFINVGDAVTVGKPVCIVEAMKLFNEIESEVSGKIVEVLVENAQPVEFDQPLFLVDPS
ncbi:MAG: acetyl-CoA carboxylase biotin carboxyl carrier protein [Cytophagales bacterium]|nr:acetyl-CoA carboxylase biotin carboxyl carrier protein [Cytophagales bacterium]